MRPLTIRQAIDALLKAGAELGWDASMNAVADDDPPEYDGEDAVLASIEVRAFPAGNRCVLVLH